MGNIRAMVWVGKILGIIGLTLSLESCASYNDFYDGKQAYEYLNLVNRFKVDPFDVARTQIALNVAYKAYYQGELDGVDEDVFLYRHARALDRLIYIKRRDHQVEPSDEAVQKALAEYTYIVNNTSNKTLKSDALMGLYRVNVDYVKDNDLAWRNLVACAKLDDGRCANILAHKYFSENLGNEIDIKEATFWYEKSVKSWTSYTCAGMFSANSLYLLNYFSKNSYTDTSWQQWREVRNAIYRDLQKLHPPTICDGDKKSLVAFAMEKLDPNLSRELALLEYDDPALNEFVRLIAEDYQIQDIAEQVKQIEHPSDQCLAYFSLAILDNSWIKESSRLMSESQDFEDADDNCGYYKTLLTVFDDR